MSEQLKFVKVRQTRRMLVNHCLKCCFHGKLSECGKAKCFPYQREDHKRGYFVKVEKE